MLIGLVRDSVMQCFCHTCRAPGILPAVSRRSVPIKKNNKTRSKQPRLSKKVKFITTEIRCQEKSRGGLSYEVILAEPAPNVPVPRRPVTPGKNVSVEEIEQKLKAAEERRINTIKIAEIKSHNDQLDCQRLEEKARIYENKLFVAEQNREKELQKRIEKVQKLERRAELVRQNKAQTQELDGQQNPVALSG
ncbi:stathmin-2 isoform X9 [Drosophila biarmipes]|uniref:stathmin-2 isoform X9 n=1 Tax=Drosophila biarmipes TaxID=125945 RepID=UPI0021CC9250|nr:stathmin-2 isoform X9 [Drosophila biarmipes]